FSSPTGRSSASADSSSSSASTSSSPHCTEPEPQARPELVPAPAPRRGIYTRPVTIRQNDPGLSADLLKAIARADHRRLDRWTAEMRRNGRVVLRTNVFKTIVWGLVCWLFVGALIVMFTVDAGAWNPLSEDFGGWLVFFVLLVFAVGFVVFGDRKSGVEGGRV